MSGQYISKILQIILAVLLVGLVVIQRESGGLSSSVGSAIKIYRSKRGLEKLLFVITIILGIAFVINSLYLISAVA